MCLTLFYLTSEFHILLNFFVMNFYIRYFDNETFVKTIDEAVYFLESIPDITVTPAMVGELREYAASDMLFPKRYKVRPRVYFIMIKTEAASMQDFKDKKALRNMHTDDIKTREQMSLSAQKYGWYEGCIEFKRVVVNHIGKCEYRDTMFAARCKAASPLDCYNRITNHLSQRVDSRSQFPSCKGKNFSYKYLGKCK